MADKSSQGSGLFRSIVLFFDRDRVKIVSAANSGTYDENESRKNVGHYIRAKKRFRTTGSHDSHFARHSGIVKTKIDFI